MSSPASAVIIFGPPFVGKGTQAQKLTQSGFVHVSTGDLLRAEVAAGSNLGKSIASLLAEGRLVSDEIALTLIDNFFSNFPASKSGVLFDGFPRTLSQAEALDGLLAASSVPLGAVLNLTYTLAGLLDRVMARRICGRCAHVYSTAMVKAAEGPAPCPLCGGDGLVRPDDTKDVFLSRMEIYTRETDPILAHYNARSLVVDIDGMAPVDTVESHIREVLRDKFFQRKLDVPLNNG